MVVGRAAFQDEDHDEETQKAEQTEDEMKNTTGGVTDRAVAEWMVCWEHPRRTFPTRLKGIKTQSVD